MSTVQEQRRLLLEERAIKELKERIGRETYLSVTEVCERLGMSREKVETLEVEILPYVDYGTPKKAMRRYHPADVAALDAVQRAYKRAEQRGEAEAFLRERRELLEARDLAALAMAEAAHERVA